MDQGDHTSIDFSLSLHSLDLPCFLTILCAGRLAQLRQLIALTYNAADRSQGPSPQGRLLCPAKAVQGTCQHAPVHSLGTAAIRGNDIMTWSNQFHRMQQDHQTMILCSGTYFSVPSLLVYKPA